MFRMYSRVGAALNRRRRAHAAAPALSSAAYIDVWRSAWRAGTRPRPDPSVHLVHRDDSAAASYVSTVIFLSRCSQPWPAGPPRQVTR
ncbi:hypothetical protein FA95DRAFT_1103557 [Auriscalpium vulgare]|uniref:Uncharacterized protein n=1 Tax=Auriscalpium vulgare TaxID=40419 RepID=A0ACB8R679_9AGAM|nr:hypothetical protein FA95DRAFT_1103557 [Auriscalpium vulgare]